MKISFKKIMLKKRFPLAISRGISGDNHNVFIKIEDEGLVAWGESCPGKSRYLKKLT